MENIPDKKYILEKTEKFSSGRLEMLPAWNVKPEDLSKQADDLEIATAVSPEFPNPYTIADANDFIARSTKSWEDGNEYSFAIYDEGKKFCGMIGFKESGPVIENIGYWLGKDSWGKGYATEVLKAALDFIRTKFPEIIEVKASAYKYNKPSQRVLEKTGFVMTGEKIKSENLRNNQTGESFIYTYKY